MFCIGSVSRIVGMIFLAGIGLTNTRYFRTSLEAAWLVWENDLVSVKEKHAAWDELIRTMQDCRIEERYRISEQDSLHDYKGLLGSLSGHIGRRTPETDLAGFLLLNWHICDMEFSYLVITK